MSSTALFLPFNSRVRWSITFLLLVALGVTAWYLQYDAQLSFSVLSGAAFGYVIQRSRFCFYCISRDFIERREARGLLGLLAALVLGLVGYHAVFGVFVPDAASGRLPPGAHIGTVSWALVFGATAFGLGMALAGSCISAVLYRLGEGAFSGLVVLPSVLLGFLLGFYCWNSVYLQFMQQSPAIWLPAELGYAGSLLVQLAVLAFLAALLFKYGRDKAAATAASAYQAIFLLRWPAYIGGILVAVIATLAYLRVAPLGVTAELGSISRSLGSQLSSFPTRLEGLDTLRGCATVVKETLLSNNGVFILALIAGAFAAALPAGDFKPSLPKLRELPRLIAGGVLMGFGAMLALGCTVGVLLSGIMASALSGWLFLLCCSAGLYVGWCLRRIKQG
ncbi:YeeE/YedE family protein [Rheinheimera muenzenbergensis]|uniref:YeeE/YedE family protein n=1 Tax=Rheinheimera muenzenbergensis TaxID=1193628 RepID=A0ABU8C4H7_9GAMM